MAGQGFAGQQARAVPGQRSFNSVEGLRWAGDAPEEPEKRYQRMAGQARCRTSKAIPREGRTLPVRVLRDSPGCGWIHAARGRNGAARARRPGDAHTPGVRCEAEPRPPVPCRSPRMLPSPPGRRRGPGREQSARAHCAGGGVHASAGIRPRIHRPRWTPTVLSWVLPAEPAPAPSREHLREPPAQADDVGGCRGLAVRGAPSGRSSGRLSRGSRRLSRATGIGGDVAARSSSSLSSWSSISRKSVT